MQPCVLDTAFFRDCFDRFVKDSSALPPDSVLFVCDETGKVRFSKGLSRLNIKFPSLLKFIGEDDRKKCLTNTCNGISGIYKSITDDNSFVAVSYGEEGSISGALIGFSEKGCSHTDQYFKKLISEKAYIEKFSKNHSFLHKEIPVLYQLNRRIEALCEIKEFDALLNYIAIIDNVVIEVNTLLNKICAYSGCYADLTFECTDEKLYTFAPAIYAKALLYQTAFFVNNGANDNIHISLKKSGNNAHISFTALFSPVDSYEIYSDTIMKILSKFPFKTTIGIKDGYLNMNTLLPLCSPSAVSVKDALSTFDAIDEILSDLQTELAFKLISGQAL